MRPRVIFLVGPTSSGKTAVSSELARRMKLEIISCDSMQIYRGMSILTAKPSLALRKKVKHHLLDFIPVTRDYNVSQYRRAALAKIKAVLRRNRTPVFAGGTGLYMSILADGIFEIDAHDESLRRKFIAQADKYGSIYLHRKLSAVDPSAALKIHPNDVRRIVRALEVYALTGKPISELQKSRKGLYEDYAVRIFCLDLERDHLYSRINERVESMFREGLIAEVRRLIKKPLSRTAAAAIGISEVSSYLRGEIGLEEAKAAVKQNTRNYARRQLTWFRKDKRVEWIKVGREDSPASVCAKIEKRLK